jgi:hypothetical protein
LLWKGTARMEGAADAKVGNLLSMTAFKQGQVESVVDNRQCAGRRR